MTTSATAVQNNIHSSPNMPYTANICAYNMYQVCNTIHSTINAKYSPHREQQLSILSPALFVVGMTGSVGVPATNSVPSILFDLGTLRVIASHFSRDERCRLFVYHVASIHNVREKK